jgi:hypothetical protein
MFREQTINFLEAIVVFLLLTNAASALAAVYAMRIVNALNPGTQAVGAVERKFQAMVARLT